MIRKISVFILFIVLLLTMVSCQDKYANVLFDELGYTKDTLSVWSAEIKYIEETRGTTDEIYTKIKYNADNTAELVKLINIFYGAQKSQAPDGFIFSAEGMSDYMFNFFKEGSETPVLSFYYSKDDNLLTRVLHRIDEKDGKEYIDYEFYVPYIDLAILAPHTDLSELAIMYRESARVPDKETTSLSLNPAQLIASVLPEELEERMTYQNDEYVQAEDAQEGEIVFQIYSDELPHDEGTACKMYDNEDIPTITEDQIVLMAKIMSETGEPLELVINFLEYNSYYTIVSVSYPNIELQESLGLKTPNAILVDRQDINPDKYIVFVDGEGKVVYVVVPFSG